MASANGAVQQNAIAVGLEDLKNSKELDLDGIEPH